MLKHRLTDEKLKEIAERAISSGESISIYCVYSSAFNKNLRIKRWEISKDVVISKHFIEGVYSHRHETKFGLTLARHSKSSPGYNKSEEILFPNYLLAWGYIQWKKQQPK